MLNFEMSQIELFPAVIDIDQNLTKISGIGAQGIAWSHRDKKLFYIEAATGLGYYWSQANGEQKAGGVSCNFVSLHYDVCNTLVACDLDKKSLVRYWNGEKTFFGENFEGVSLAPRSVVPHSSGILYAASQLGIYMIMPESFVAIKATENIVMNPTGLCLSVNEDRMLYIDKACGSIGVMDFLPNGTFMRSITLAYGTEFPEGPPMDIVVDRIGRVYTAAASLICIFNEAGLRIGNVRLPSRPSALCLGGDGLNTLFIAAQDGIYKLQIRYR